MPVLFLPDRSALFVWRDDLGTLGLAQLLSAGEPAQATLVLPEGLRNVDGTKLPLLASATELAVLDAAALATLPSSLATWALASKLAFELVSRERVLPTLSRQQGRMAARWAMALSASEDIAKVRQLARYMPPSAHAVAAAGGAADLRVWAPEALLRAFLDAVADALVRSTKGGPALRSEQRPTSAPAARWEQRFSAALTGADDSFAVSGFGERSVVDELARWSAPAVGSHDRLRACFRLELPERDHDSFVLRFLLQSPSDPSLQVSATDVWSARGRELASFGRALGDPSEALLLALGRAARLFPPLEAALRERAPTHIVLDPGAAFGFLDEGATRLAEAGFGVMVPAELTASGQRRLRLRMRVGGGAHVAGVVAGASPLGMEQLLAVDWQAAIGDHTLTERELGALAAQKAPLVRFRGEWVAIDARELSAIQRQLSLGPTQITMREAVQAALSGETREGELLATVTASGAFATLLDRVRDAAQGEREAPDTLLATLRPYQQRGLAWLSTMGSLGLGACLADDMGLGKTVQMLSFLLWRAEAQPHDRRPTLLVAPTSVVGNWEREAARFAPSLRVVPHFGGDRAKAAADFAREPRALVMTTYGLLRRDAALLGTVDWAAVVLDEAQNIKNAASTTARAARVLRAGQRFALTGTPVENRLAELWSILEFCNPGLLGALTTFRRDFAVPVERYNDAAAAERLRRLVGPFLLRRVKSDPAVIQDLPEKNEAKVFCTLTREQATLYQAVVDEELRRIAESEGIERRGRVLALLTYLKQICNHPAHYLADRSALGGRSGKLARVTEMLEEAMAAGDKALVFTQYREMGERLRTHFGEQLGVGVAFLHGGTRKKERDELVQQFQHDPRGPRIFVLSLKAGGTGLNLTAASHVFHFDRWWNPAVEDQATDRAYRIGQKRSVQVHKLICAGTVEDKVDQLLEQKRKLATQVVGSGEQWITELGNDDLRALFALSSDAVLDTDGSEEVSA